jgi:RNA polymerase sigma factor (sigma-70 family)
VYSLSIKILNDISEAEDVMHDVFIKVRQSLKSFNPEKSRFSTWISSLTVKTCLDYLRRTKYDVRIESGVVAGRYCFVDETNSFEDGELLKMIKSISLRYASKI